MRQQPTGDSDAAAKNLAARLGGLPSQMVPGFERREFDVVSDTYIAQTTASRNAATKPGNFLTSNRKAQIRATLQAAKQEGKIAYFEFTGGGLHPEVLECIARNAARLGALYVIAVLENKP